MYTTPVIMFARILFVGNQWKWTLKDPTASKRNEDYYLDYGEASSLDDAIQRATSAAWGFNPFCPVKYTLPDLKPMQQFA